MMRSAIIVWLAAYTAAAPVPNLDDDAGATSWGSLTVANLDLAIQEHHGRRRSELTAEELTATALPIIIRTSSVASAAAMCAEAPAYHCECLQQYHTVLVGLAVSCTLPDAERLLGPHNAEIVDMEASLELEVDAVQGAAPWGLDRIDQAALPLDSQYHYSSYQGAGVKVFVVDTGVRCTHEDFRGRCIPGWQPSGPCSPTDFTCANDDVHWHGTHVAGTVAGTTFGVAKAATVIAVKVMRSDGKISTYDLVAAWDWVADQKALEPDTPMVFQMSLGIRTRWHSNDYDVGLRAVVDAGIVAVQAAGNQNDDACFYPPRNAPAVIKVGATTSADRRSWFSNYGDCVDIYAPGSAILSAHSASDTATHTAQGTSMAAPHVSGVLAIMLSEDPTLTPAQATAALLAAALADGTIADTRAPSVFLQAPSPIMAPVTSEPTPSPTLAPVTSEPTQPTVTAPLQVTSGASYCEIDSDGCVTDGAGDHGNNEACTVRVNTAGFLTATHFDTERRYDYVTIGGTRYEGSTGPSNVAVAAGSIFSWHTDGSVTNSGWVICHAPTPPLQVTSGASYCEIDSAGCVTDGAGDHGNNEACTVRVNTAGFLTATHFDTERRYDYVTIGGTRYEGSTGPSNVAVAAGSTFSWRADGSVTNSGWVICHASRS